VVKPSDRVRLLLRELEGRGINLALISTPVNLRYLTGIGLKAFERFSALLLCVGTGEVTLIVPKLDEGKAIATGLPYLTYLDQEGPLGAIRRATSGCGGVRVVGFEGNAPIRNLWVLRGVLGRFRDEDIDPVLAGMRIVKDEDELGSIKAAVRAIEEGLRAAREAIRAGMTPFPSWWDGFHCGGLGRYPLFGGYWFHLGVVETVGYRPTGSSESR
jgi:Xaa-Pro dipeptidase